MSVYIEREAACALMPDDYYGWRDKQLLKSAPAADVAPVRHGRWTDKRTIEHDGEWYCSECGNEITIYMGPERPDRYHYCPNCGTKMDKEKE